MVGARLVRLVLSVSLSPVPFWSSILICADLSVSTGYSPVTHGRSRGRSLVVQVLGSVSSSRSANTGARFEETMHATGRLAGVPEGGGANEGGGCSTPMSRFVRVCKR